MRRPPELRFRLVRRAKVCINIHRQPKTTAMPFTRSYLTITLETFAKAASALIALMTVCPIHAETIRFGSVPTVLPRDTRLPTYSPALSLGYSALNQGIYTLKVFLLEGGVANPPCGSTQWCARTFTIDNQSGSNASGKILVVEPMDVFDFQSFLWVAELYSPANAAVPIVKTTQAAASTANRAPVLRAIGNRTGFAGQALSFKVKAADPEGDAVAITAENLPPGATFDTQTRKFNWPVPVAGAYRSIVFTATQRGSVALTDAERIKIRITVPSRPSSLAFGTHSYVVTEGGLARITVTRSGGSDGMVSVDYKTKNGNAIEGADYTPAMGTLTFAAGETGSKTIKIRIVNDQAAEPDESFEVSLSNPTGGATLDMVSKATVTIVDDD